MSGVHTALAKRFAAPAWALAFEVADATGFGKTRSADAVAMNAALAEVRALRGGS